MATSLFFRGINVAARKERFGGAVQPHAGTRVRREGNRIRSRWLTDLRYAIRFLWTHKSFTATAVLTLAIGLGANTALYGLLNAALRPLALPHPEQIVAIAAETKGDETGGFQYLVLDRSAEGLSGAGRVVQRRRRHHAAHGRPVDRRPGVAVLVRRRQRQLLHRPRRHAGARHALHEQVRARRSTSSSGTRSG